MTIAWIIVARFSASSGSKMLGSSCRDEVPTCERPEEQRGEQDPDGLVAPEQRDRDPGEADEVRIEVADVDVVPPAEEVDAAGEAREGAGDREREEVVAPRRRCRRNARPRG